MKVCQWKFIRQCERLWEVEPGEIIRARIFVGHLDDEILGKEREL